MKTNLSLSIWTTLSLFVCIILRTAANRFTSKTSTVDLDSLLFKPILQADEKISTNEDSNSNTDESFTWTFYTLANISSVVDIRWYGSSNGYYSERVDLDINNYDIKSLPNYAYIAEHHPQFLI